MELRKRVGQQEEEIEAPSWLRLEALAEVTVSSADGSAPIDAAVVDGIAGGWRAGVPGAQWLRIRFDRPQEVAVIHLVFEETGEERLQEFALRWSDDGARTYRPLVRQQFSFSPSGATREVEHYHVNLRGVTDLELHIVPDVSRRPRFATLAALRLR